MARISSLHRLIAKSIRGKAPKAKSSKIPRIRASKPSALADALMRQQPVSQLPAGIQTMAPQVTTPVASREDIVARALDFIQRRNAMQSLAEMNQS